MVGNERSLAVAAVTAFFMLAAAAPVRCAIDGTPDHVRIEAQSETLETLFAGLRDKFGLTYRSSIPLDQTVDGTFSGELASVVRNLLRQYDYIAKVERGALSVTILARSRPSAGTGAAANSPPAATSPPSSPLPRAAQAAAQGTKPGGSAAVTPLQTDGQPRRRPVSISSYMQSQITAFTTAPAENPAAAAPGNARGGMPAVTQSAIADLTQKASATLRDLTAALSGVSR
jgi:hypothetical protein